MLKETLMNMVPLNPIARTGKLTNSRKNPEFLTNDLLVKIINSNLWSLVAKNSSNTTLSILLISKTDSVEKK
jgi:hypothetical protein